MIKQIQKQYLKDDGFSLTELLIVLVIIGILVMIAIPIYNNITTKAKMTEAKLMLNQVHTLQITYKLEYDKYSADLKQIGFEPEKLIEDGGKARYIIKIEKADTKTYTATATSTIDFNDDGIFNVWEVNESGIIEIKVDD